MPHATSLFPRLPLLAVFAAIAGSIGLAAMGPAAGGRSPPPSGAVLAERTLRFEDRPDGAVVVREGPAEVAVFEGEQGFLRGALRGLARLRKMDGLDSAAPFRLAAWADGRLTLTDQATGQRIDLEAFGATNAGVFAHLLEPSR